MCQNKCYKDDVEIQGIINPKNMYVINKIN